ncbi:MAG: GNAT family N-acetyltransferase [Solirubrobacteraceae bacterium]
MKPRIPADFERGPLGYERIRPQHAAELEPLALDPLVWRTLQYPSEPPPTPADVRRTAARKHAHWESHGFGQWLLRDRSDGLAVGRGGLQYTEATGTWEVEIGWAVLPARWGQGFATELAQTSIQAAFESLGLEDVIAYTQPENLASRRVMDKAGLRYEGDFTHEDMPHVLYRLRAPGKVSS